MGVTLKLSSLGAEAPAAAGADDAGRFRGIDDAEDDIADDHVGGVVGGGLRHYPAEAIISNRHKPVLDVAKSCPSASSLIPSWVPLNLPVMKCSLILKNFKASMFKAP
jgi:hypothetical protein